MPTAIDIAREVFPAEDDVTLEGLLWSRTGYPCFWSLKDGQTIAGKLKEQLNEFKHALTLILQYPKEWHLCDFCNHIIPPGRDVCYKCDYNRPNDDIVWC